jgi:hypothetical protein
MSWVNDLASSAGMPAGAATLAVAMYAACAAAEKAARPEALADIGRILKDTTWERSARPSAIIERVFTWTFGERHLSLKCLLRSALGTLALVISVGLVNIMETQSGEIGYKLQMLFFVGFLPDYVALLKTRCLFIFLKQRGGSVRLIILSSSDIICSMIISSLFMALSLAIYALVKIYPWNDPNYPVTPYQTVLFIWELMAPTFNPMRHLAKLTYAPLEAITLYDVLYMSTLFTSIWMALVLLSTAVLKLLAPLHRFTGWFFDVEKHPVQAIGIVAGALVMVGSLIWTVLRALI